MILDIRQDAVKTALAAGAYRASVIETGDVQFFPAFRQACEANSCGMFGRCWMCPPDIGPVDRLIAQAQQYRHVLVYQTVRPLEDSFDIEGMLEAGNLHNQVAEQVGAAFRGEKFLHLGAGGCRVCQRCAKAENLPCRFPDRALSSLEAYGVDVTLLAQAAGMNYINGKDTVTYFGAVFW